MMHLVNIIRDEVGRVWLGWHWLSQRKEDTLIKSRQNLRACGSLSSEIYNRVT